MPRRSGGRPSISWKRVCLSVFYDFSVIAKTDPAGLASIEQGVSINDSGKVAFVASQSGGQSVYVGDRKSVV